MQGDIGSYRVYVQDQLFTQLAGCKPLTTLPAGTFTYTVLDLNKGTLYYFAVVAVDTKGNALSSVTPVSAIPADTSPPETAIVAGPADASYLGSTSVTFAWSGSDNAGGPLTYSYRLDSEDWSPFSPSASQTFENLSQGLHSFYVRAMDQSGNQDPTPSQRNFVVDTVLPESATESERDICRNWNSPGMVPFSVL